MCLTAPHSEAVFLCPFSVDCKAQLCIKGLGSNQIAKQINKEKVLNPSSYNLLKRGKSIGRTPKDPTHWVGETVSRILERPEYAGHTV
ncbi:MAG: recombinase family protein, partial [Oscillospiraceae bacterium]